MKLEKHLAEVARADAPLHAVHAHPAYRADIDGLRAVAVLSVVLFHAFPALLPGGFIGVDIFFIISGFLIGSILIGSLQRNSFSFADFYARRVRRIFPALAVVLAACIATGWAMLFADEFKMLGKHVVGGVGFVSNFFLWQEVGYFDTAAETKPLLHLWSLGIEEQFYIFWPVLLMLAHKLRWNLLGVALSLSLLSFLINVAGVHAFPSATFYSPASRVWELLLGASLAYVSVNRLGFFVGVNRGAQGITQIDFGSPRARNVQAILGFGMIALGLVLVSRGKAFPGWWALLPAVGAFLLIAAGPQAWINRVLLSSRLLVGIGLISYPLYLWHWPLLSFAQILESGAPSPQIRAGAVAAALVLAWLTYRLVEKPLRGPSHGRLKVAVLSLVLLAVALSGAYVYKRDGLPKRSAVAGNALLQKDLVLVEDVANAKACKARYGFASFYEYCLLDDVTKDPTVVLLGDSHAYHLVAGMTRYWRGQGENLWKLGTRVPFFDMPPGTDPYQQATPRLMELALNTPSVKTIVISTAFKMHTENDEGKAQVAKFRTTLQKFTASGRQVIWINDVPMLDFEPRACIGRGIVASSKTRRDCSLPRATFDQAVAKHNVTVAAVLKDFPQVQLFDAAAQLCDDVKCKVMLDGMLIYRDTHHLSYRGDLWMGERFAQQQAALKAARR